nr:SPASM domain-containing protein [bacterium]
KVDRVRIYCEHSSGGNFGKVGDDSETGIQRKACHKPFQNIVICWDGKIALCNHDWKAEEFRFNAKTKSIMEIWNSEEYEIIRKNHNENNFSRKSVCFACDHWLEFYDDSIKGELYLNPDSALNVK